MRLKVYKIFIVLFFLNSYSYSQNKVSGFAFESGTEIKLNEVSVYDAEVGLITKTNSIGYYEFTTEKSVITLVFIADGYQFIEKYLSIEFDTNLDIVFSIKNYFNYLDLMMFKVQPSLLGKNRKLYQWIYPWLT